MSPINGQNRALIAALQAELARRRGRRCPSTGATATGIRCSDRHAAADGRRRRAAGAGVRDLGLQFLLRLPAVSRGRRAGPRRRWARALPQVEKLRPSTTIPASSRPNADRVREALAQRPRRAPGGGCGSRSRRTAFRCRWPAGCAVRGAAAGGLRRSWLRRWAGDPWALAYQSRSGPPRQPWLEPDIRDHLKRLHHDEASRDVVVAPIGFLSDHMEVVYDLDTEAAAVRSSSA